MARAAQNTIVTNHKDGTQTTEVVDWTPEELAAFAVHEANAWKGQREAAYPSIQEQLDMLYWDKINNASSWTDAITAVKVAHPKPAV